MENHDYGIKKFLRKNGYFPSGNYINIAIGCAMRNGDLFETIIFFHSDKEQSFHVVGHGEGIYNTLEEVAIAIALPEF